MLAVDRATSAGIAGETQPVDSCPKGHPWDEKNTAWLGDSRRCRACRRSHAARVAALAGWEKHRDRMMAGCRAGGAAQLKSHLVKISRWRLGPICAGGLVQGRHIAADGRAACPTCDKRITVTRYNQMRAHKERIA